MDNIIKVIRDDEESYQLRGPRTSVGTVWNKWFRRPDDEDDLLIAMVVYAPGARSHWHRHAEGTFLFITEGQGLLKQEGQPGNHVVKGDVVLVPGGVWHWHAGSPGSIMIHFAMTPAQPTDWGAEVSDEDYEVEFPAHEDSTPNQDRDADDPYRV